MTLPFSTQDYIKQLEDIAKAHSISDSVDRQLAKLLDDRDALASLRKQYFLPSRHDVCAASKRKAGDHADDTPTEKNGDAQETSLYMCGNSLGPLSRLSRRYVEEELEAWGSKAVLGHWDHPFGRPWTRCEERASHLMSDIVGAKRDEVVAMGTLTSNLHVMLASFYRPGATSLILGAGDTNGTSKEHKPKHKIIYEALAFPSDQYALASAVALAGYDPQTSLVPLRGNGDERTLRTEDVIGVIEREAATGELGLVLLGDIQYQTGQMFDVQRITKRARELDVIIGWDLAHAFANVPLALHDWDVDFAVWCTYKYGSSGPGGIAGIFVNERWGNIGFSTCVGRDVNDGQSNSTKGAQGFPRAAGWWGHTKQTRFSMPDSFKAMDGASGWQQSNPSALDLASLTGSLETLLMAPKLLNAQYDFDKVEIDARNVGYGTIMPALRSKSQCLTTYLEHLITKSGFLPESANIKIVTPQEGRFRGSMLSICIPDNDAGKQQTNEKDTMEADTAVKGRSNVPPPIASTSLISRVHKRMEASHGVVCDIRHPDVLRIAPVAQFNTFDDVWQTADALRSSINEEL